jgi:flagellar hook-associated protein 1 FlgK
LQPGQPGGALRIDGIPFTGAQGAKLGGALGGALQVRDVIAPSFGRQIDEVARGLIETFAEADQSSAASAPALAGLFTYSGGPGLPVAGVVVPGMARSIRVNPNGDPAQGGDLARLRDGNLSAPGNPSYNYNPSGATGFSGRLRQLAGDLSSARTFDVAAGLGTDKNLLQFATDSAGWLESERASAADDLQQKQVLSERAAGAWHSAVGINLDEELTTLMSLEKSFQASSRMISTVSAMFDALLQMAR